MNTFFPIQHEVEIEKNTPIDMIDLIQKIYGFEDAYREPVKRFIDTGDYEDLLDIFIEATRIQIDEFNKKRSNSSERKMSPNHHEVVNAGVKFMFEHKCKGIEHVSDSAKIIRIVETDNLVQV